MPQPFRPAMVEDESRGRCSVITGHDDEMMPAYCDWIAAFACPHYPGLLVCAEHYDQRPMTFATTHNGTTTLHGRPRMAVQLDHLLDRLDTEDDDRVRGDLIEDVFRLVDLQPSLAKRARHAGIPA